MSKAAAKKKTTTAETQVQGYMDALDAKKMFLGATANMSWRLAITVVVPIIVGVKLDEHFHSSPSYTLTGIILAATAGCMAVWSTVKAVNAQQAEEASQSNKKRSVTRVQ